MKTLLTTAFTLLLLTPTLTHAQGPSLQALLTNIPKFIDAALIPFLFGIAFLAFAFNTIRYFVLEGSNEEGRKKAKDFALYSVFAFVFLVIFFGIVNMLTQSTGLDKCKQPMSDYQGKFNTYAGPQPGC